VRAWRCSVKQPAKKNPQASTQRIIATSASQPALEPIANRPPSENLRLATCIFSPQADNHRTPLPVSPPPPGRAPPPRRSFPFFAYFLVSRLHGNSVCIPPSFRPCSSFRVPGSPSVRELIPQLANQIHLPECRLGGHSSPPALLSVCRVNNVLEHLRSGGELESTGCWTCQWRVVVDQQAT
jgi:hypothetical protein